MRGFRIPSAVLLVAAFAVGCQDTPTAPSAEVIQPLFEGPSSVILATFQHSIGGGSGLGTGIGGSPSMALCLMYDFVTFNLGAKPPQVAGPTIGCDISHVPGTTGPFDFNAGNSTDFAAFTARATNGTDDILSSGTFVLDDAGKLLPGGGSSAVGGNSESFSFGGSPDLAGSTIDFVRLIVNNVEITTDTDPSGNLRVTSKSGAVWQFFGSRPPSIVVQIDIKPGSDPNSINCTNLEEVVTVAILTTATFDATTVDHTMVTFQGAAETHVSRKTFEARRHDEDVDGDGDTDLVQHFRLGDTDLTCSSTVGTLSGETFDGQAIEGTDAVRMIG